MKNSAAPTNRIKALFLPILLGLGLMAGATAAAPPTIKITSVPPYGTSGMMQGVVTGVDFSAYQVAPFIQVEGLGWYSKPNHSSTVPINADGTFTANVTTGGLDDLATTFCAALVANGYTPPDAFGASSVPSSLISAAIDFTERYGRTIAFAGRTWAVKDAPLLVGPGAYPYQNYFSDLASDVWVDSAGLHLTIHNHDGKWWCSEIILLDHLGYGTYTFKTNSRTDIMAINAVLGMYTYDTYGDNATSGGSPFREIDFEDSRWNVASGPNTQDVVQPFGTPGNRHQYDLPDLSTGAALTRTFKWQPNLLNFTALQDNQANPFDQLTYATNAAAGHYVPATGRERVRLNLWLSNAAAPADGQPIEIVVSNFSFTPLTARQVSVKDDFNGDGKTDLALWNATSRQTQINDLNGTTSLGAMNGPVLPSGWTLADVADCDGDGKPDMVLFNPATRQTLIWYMNGVTVVRTAFGPILPVGYDLVATAAFNPDGRPDFVLLNHATQQTMIVFLNNNTQTGSAAGPTIASGWELAGVADFNGDSNPDFLLFNPKTGGTAIWYLSGTALKNGAFGPTLPAGNVLGGIGDFNGDGKPDFILVNPATHATTFWLMNGTTSIGSAAGPLLPSGFTLVAP